MSKKKKKNTTTTTKTAKKQLSAISCTTIAVVYSLHTKEIQV